MYLDEKPAAHRWWGKRPGLFVNNSRFYILLFSICISLLVICYFRINIASTTLYTIRVQQLFGFLSLTFWYFALLATPMQTVFGKDGFMKQYLYARRALGVSAAYFAVLHMLFGLFGQLGGVSQVFILPDRFKLAVLFGAAGLVVLVLMAATSFDKVIDWLTFPRWKWLHRLAYIASILVLLHIWIIGTHLGYTWVRVVMFGMLALFLVLESWRIATVLQKKLNKTSDKEFRVEIFMALAAISLAALLIVPNVINSYHSSHTDHEQVGAEH